MSEEMTAPVTRGELLEVLSAYPTSVELRTELATFRNEMRAEMRETFAMFRVELGEDIARHMKAGFEDMRKLFGVLDDKQHAQNDQHASLARRVDRLEVAVFDPPNPKP